MKKKALALVCAVFLAMAAGCATAATNTSGEVSTTGTATVSATAAGSSTSASTVQTTTTTTADTTTAPTTSTERTTTTTKWTTTTTKRTTTTTKRTTTTTKRTTTTTKRTTTTAPTEEKTIKIFIDQGHNPHSYNTGAQGHGLREQDVTYTVGKKVAELLVQDSRFEVMLSRPNADTMVGTDNNSSLRTRTAMANEWGADYYISIHCNAHSTATARGVEAFAYSAGGEGYALGSLIVDSLVAATGFPKRGMKVSDYYWVLRGTAMPAVLVEMAFITHAEEAALLGSNPDLFANAIAAGILAYFE